MTVGAGEGWQVRQADVTWALPRLERRDLQMAELDALPWSDGVAFFSCGVRLGVRTDDGTLLERALSYLPPGWTHAPSPVVDEIYSLRRALGGAVPRLYEGARELASLAADVPMQLDHLRSLLEHRIATSATSRLFVHAGVVEWDGRAILIPGRSLSGKTTLVAALVRLGARYYSDEFALLDADGLVHPWARRLRMRARGSPPRLCPVEALGGEAGRRPLAVGLVALTAYRPGARWRPRHLSRGRAVLKLMDNSLVARVRPELTLRVLTRAVGTATAVTSWRGEADTVAAALLRLAGTAASDAHPIRTAAKEEAQ